MTEIGSIHTFDDPGFLRWTNRCAIAVIASGAAALIILAVLGAREAFARPTPDGSIFSWACIFLVGAGFAMALVAHELSHALLFKLLAPDGARVTFGANWRVGMIFACAQGVVYTRRRYQVIACAPSVLVTAAALAAGTASGHLLAAIGVCVLHLSCCVGDWGYLRAIRRDPRITHCEDTLWGVRFFGESVGRRS